MFHDFKELRDLPVKVQRQILLALRDISGNSDRPLEQRAEANYAAAIMTLLRIGTVAPRTPLSSEYIGYDIDATEVLCRLKSAAEDDSPSAQAIYYRVSTGLTLRSRRNDTVLVNVRNVPEEGLVPRQTIVKWLERATMLGSHIASSTLRELEPTAWEKANSLFRTEYCGVGRRLFDNGVSTVHQLASPLSSLGMPASQNVREYGDTVLHVAATIGKLDVVQRLTRDAPHHHVNMQNDRGETALLQAARSGHYAIVQHLVGVGASAAILTHNSESPLHWLCAFVNEKEEELLDLAKSLCQSGAEIDGVCAPSIVFNDHFRDSLGGGTPLCRAVQRDAYIAAKALVSLGADPYKDRERGEQDTAPHAAALACCTHNSRMLELFLTAMPIRPPRWYGLAGMFDPDQSWEVFRAFWSGTRSFQTAAPNAFRSMLERGDQRSLLGYAVHPDLLHARMALLGESYLEQMKLTIDKLAAIKSQEFDRVTNDYESALMVSVLSRDVSLVSYLLSRYPDQTLPALTNPVPCGLAMHLPVQLALARGERPIFDLLLGHAGPATRVRITTMKGMTDNWFSQGVLWLLSSKSTIASAKVSRICRNAVHLASIAHPDPHFMRALLSGLPAPDARKLANSHGKVWDETPLLSALGNNYFDVADVLLEYGANIEEEASNVSGKAGHTYTPLGAIVNFNNSGTAAAVSWLLRHGASHIVNRRYGLTAITAAVRVGASWDTSTSDLSLPTRLYDLRLPVLTRLIDHFSNPEQINYRPGNRWGFTALHLAVLRLSPETVQELLRAGADLQATIEFRGSQRTVQELAGMLGVDDIPDIAKQRGPREVARYLELIRLVRNILDAAGST